MYRLLPYASTQRHLTRFFLAGSLSPLLRALSPSCGSGSGGGVAPRDAGSRLKSAVDARMAADAVPYGFGVGLGSGDELPSVGDDSQAWRSWRSGDSSSGGGLPLAKEVGGEGSMRPAPSEAGVARAEAMVCLDERRRGELAQDGRVKGRGLRQAE